MGAQAAVAYRPYAMNMWMFIKHDGFKMATEDRDRAVEYCRRYCVDAKVFRLVLLGMGIITNHLRHSSKEVIHYMADFTVPQLRLPDSTEGNRRVSMWCEAQVETSKGQRRAIRDRVFEMVLIVNPAGLIEDVDLQPLSAKLARKFEQQFGRVKH